MAESLLAGKSERLVSLDVFRGVTIAGMVLVNNPGSWGTLWPPLGHAHWHGWTPTDFVFPFFLFIVGVAMVYSFDRRVAQGQSKLRLFEQIVRRTIILILLGFILSTYPNFLLLMPFALIIVGLGFLFANEPVFKTNGSPEALRNKILGWFIIGIALIWLLVVFKVYYVKSVGFSFFKIDDQGLSITWETLWRTDGDGGRQLRIPGVLQRIAVAYFFASLIMMLSSKWRVRVGWTVGLLLGYWLILRFVSAPAGYEVTGNWEGAESHIPGTSYGGALHDWIDTKIFGPFLYSGRPDPEGLLSTLGAIASVMCGALTGTWLRSEGRDKIEKVSGMFMVGCVLLAIGLFWGFYPPLGAELTDKPLYWLPINKKIWTSSYVLLTTGFALLFLGVCYYAIDIKGYRKWAKPFVIFGTNAIFVFFASGILARTMLMFEIGGKNIKTILYESLFMSWLGVENAAGEMVSTPLAAHTYAIVYVVVWLGLTYPLYRKRIFLKI